MRAVSGMQLAANAEGLATDAQLKAMGSQPALRQSARRGRGTRMGLAVAEMMPTCRRRAAKKAADSDASDPDEQPGSPEWQPNTKCTTKTKAAPKKQGRKKAAGRNGDGSPPAEESFQGWRQDSFADAADFLLEAAQALPDDNNDKPPPLIRRAPLYHTTGRRGRARRKPEPEPAYREPSPDFGRPDIAVYEVPNPENTATTPSPGRAALPFAHISLPRGAAGPIETGLKDMSISLEDGFKAAEEGSGFQGQEAGASAQDNCNTGEQQPGSDQPGTAAPAEQSNAAKATAPEHKNPAHTSAGSDAEQIIDGVFTRWTPVSGT